MELQDQYHAIIPRYPELAGQVAVVTGAGQGIGQGIAMRLAREGMRVVLVDMNAERLTATTTQLRDFGAIVLDFLADLSQKETIPQLFKTTVETFGRVDLLVNNAADLRRKNLLDEHEDVLENQLAVNIRAPYLCSYHAAKIMRDAGGGNIINISSVGALRAHVKGLPYDVTKGALNSMTQAMAIDLAEYNIRVNAIGPGATQTWRSSPESPRYKAMVEMIPLRRFGEIAELSSVVAFLASPEAGYITGQVIYVDGGITVQLSPPGQML
jgi:3-oxoacyl-[acyl-carrier protein] reductase